MINDLDRTLETLLVTRGKLNRGYIDIAFNQPTRDWSATLTRPTINCWLFDIRENAQLRSHDMTIDHDMERHRASRHIAPFRFSLKYLLTAWANEVEDEHQLLWRALSVLCAVPMLDPEQCEGALRTQEFEIPIRVGQMEDTGVNLTDLWSVLGNDMRAGFTIDVTLALDLQKPIEEELPLVSEGRIQIGQTPYPQGMKLEESGRDDVEFPRSQADSLADLIENLRPKNRPD